MKKYHFLLLSISLLILSCSNNIETSPKEDLTSKMLKSKELSLDETYEFQKLPRPVNYIPTNKLSNQADGINETAIQQYLVEGKAFVTESGFPNHLNKGDWMQENTIEAATNKYKSYIVKHKKHDYINVFRQYASQFILIDYQLLANDDEKSQRLIAFYTKELIASEAKSFKLIAYCFDKLESYWTKDEITNYANKIIETYNNSSELLLMKKSLEETKSKLSNTQNEYEIAPLTKAIKVQEDFLKELEQGITKIKTFQ